MEDNDTQKGAATAYDYGIYLLAIFAIVFSVIFCCSAAFSIILNKWKPGVALFVLGVILNVVFNVYNFLRYSAKINVLTAGTKTP